LRRRQTTKRKHKKCCLLRSALKHRAGERNELSTKRVAAVELLLASVHCIVLGAPPPNRVLPIGCAILIKNLQRRGGGKIQEAEGRGKWHRNDY